MSRNIEKIFENVSLNKDSLKKKLMKNFLKNIFLNGLIAIFVLGVIALAFKFVFQINNFLVSLVKKESLPYYFNFLLLLGLIFFLGLLILIIQNIFLKKNNFFSQLIFKKKTGKVVLVEINQGIYLLGFTSNNCFQKVNNENLIKVFIPLVPLTSGFLVFVPENKVIFLDISITQAVQLILSGGFLIKEEEK